MAEETDVSAQPGAAAPPRLTSELISNAVSELEARNVTLERELEELRQAAADRVEQVGSLERLAAQATARVQELESATSEATARATADVTQALEAAERELELERAAGADRVTRLEQAEALVATTLHDADTVRARMAEVEADMADRDDRLRRAEGVIAELTEANAALRAELDQARQAAMDAVETIMSLEGAAEEGRLATENVETRVAEIARERDETASRLAAAEADADDLRALLAAAETAAAEHAADADAAGRGADELQREVHESRVRVEQISQAAEGALDAARRRLADADRELQVGLRSMQRDDEVSVADLLRLLAVHDVLMVVDGDHLASAAFPELSIEIARMRVSDAFTHERGPHSATVRIVFDADRPETVPSSPHGGTIITAVPQVAVPAALQDALEHTPLGHDLYLVGAAEPIDSLRLVTVIDMDIAVALVQALGQADAEASADTAIEAAAGRDEIDEPADHTDTDHGDGHSHSREIDLVDIADDNEIVDSEIDLTADATEPAAPAAATFAPAAPAAATFEPAAPAAATFEPAAPDEPELATALQTAPPSSLTVPPPPPSPAPIAPPTAAERKPRWGEPPEPVSVVARPRRPTIINGSPVHAEEPDAPQRPWWRRRG